MWTKSTLNLFLSMLGLLTLVFAAACDQGAGTDSRYADMKMFGTDLNDVTPVIAKVGDIEISQKDLDLRFSELGDKDQKHFAGDNGKRQLLKVMISEAIVYQEAVKSKVYLDPGISQRLIALKRMALIGAYRNVVLNKNFEPTPEQIREYYEDNKDKFVLLGRARAQHIETSTREKAQAAYDKIVAGGSRDALFPYVVTDFSENKVTAKSGGQVGWFNKGGVVPYVSDGPEFSNLVFDWDMGLHEPVKIGNRWHVIEMLERVPSRSKTISESTDAIIQELTPILLQEMEDELVSRKIDELGVEYYGKYQPGNGRTAKELFKLGLMAKSLDKQEGFLLQVVEEFPESEYAPKSLFMLANAFMDNYRDKRNARINLYRLIRDYPDCELYDDAKYMMDNLNNAEFANPKTIEELRGE